MQKGICLLLLLGFLSTQAQKTVVDVNASNASAVGATSYFAVGSVPFVNTKFVNLLEGTPYLTDNWLKGSFVGKNGQRYSGSLLRLDMVSNELHFLDKSGTEMVSSVAPREIWLEDTVKNKSYHFINSSFLPPASNNDRNEWYQLLDTGKVRLYKAYVKMVSETLPYNASTHEQRIHTRDKYYVEVDRTMVFIKNIKDIPSILSTKKSDLETYLSKSDDKNLPVDQRLRNIIGYYNSINP